MKRTTLVYYIDPNKGYKRLIECFRCWEEENNRFTLIEIT